MRLRSSASVTALSVAAILVAPARARAAENDASARKVASNEDGEFPQTPRAVDRKYPRPTLVWGLTQLLPSPTWFVGDGRNGETQAQFALGFQVTPVLFSFATHKSISPWRFFVADPWARHGGSVELFAAPYILLRDAHFASKFGARFYVPIEGHGERLSFATGASCFVASEGSSVAFDAGLYTAQGMRGIEASWIPNLDPYAFAISLRVRSL